MKPEYDLAGNVIDLAMKIHATLGAGFLESVYHQALAYELKKNSIPFESEKPLKVLYEGISVGEFTADLVVKDELIVELKAVQSLATVHEVQTVNYLVATGIDTGLLLNFGAESLEFKRKYRVCKPRPRRSPPQF